QIAFEVGGLQAVLDGGHEATGIGTVHDLVVVGQRQVDHLADGDRIDAVLGDDHRALDNSTGAQDSGLWRNQDRGVGQRTLGTDVGDGRGATGQIVRLQLVVACTISQIHDRLGDLRQAQVLRVV